MSDNNEFNDINSEIEDIKTDLEMDRPPKDETDLTGMDMKSAKEYVLSYLTTLKQTQKDMKAVSDEAELWKSRIKIAGESGKPELKSAAEAKLAEIAAKYDRLKAEETDLAGKVQELITNLKKLQHAGFTPSVNVDLLQAEFDMIVGEKDEVAAQLKEEETAAELENLKKKMSGGGV